MSGGVTNSVSDLAISGSGVEENVGIATASMRPLGGGGSGTVAVHFIGSGTAALRSLTVSGAAPAISSPPPYVIPPPTMKTPPRAYAANGVEIRARLPHVDFAAQVVSAIVTLPDGHSYEVAADRVGVDGVRCWYPNVAGVRVQWKTRPRMPR